MFFPYERYKLLAEPIPVHYPASEEDHARWIVQTIEKAEQALTRLLNQPRPEMEILLVSGEDWPLAPHDETEDVSLPHPYWTDVTTPPSIVIPTEVDPLLGEMTPQKLAFLLYHHVALAYLEDDPRPWPNDYPLWADEWQLKFAALWLSHTLDGQQGTVHSDLREHYAEIFEPELDGKTPTTVRGFYWDEETSADDYLGFELLLEQFAADLLDHSDSGVLPRFLALYRSGHDVLLSDDVTEMLATALGPGGISWLENLDYF